jgi:hypothetical protein
MGQREATQQSLADQRAAELERFNSIVEEHEMVFGVLATVR